MGDYPRYYDMLQALIDSITQDPDQHTRLANLQQLYKDSNRMLLQARDQAAYDLRSRYSSEDAEILARTPRKYIDYWAKRWQKRNGLPRLRNKRRTDLTGITVDLSGGGRFPTNLPR